MRLLRYIIIILILITMSCAVTSCKHKGYERRKKVPEIPASQTTHGHMDEMEQYVYDRIGDGVFFASPLFGPDDPKLITIYIDRNEDETDIGVFDKARCLINDYMRDHSDFFLNDGYMIKLVYLKHYHHFGASDGNEEIGYSTNYFNYEGETQRGYIEISNVYDSISVINFTTFSEGTTEPRIIIS